MMDRRTLIILVVLATLAAPARGHDYWLQPATFTPASGKPVALALHVGDGFVSEAERPFQKKPTLHCRLYSSSDTVDLAASAREGGRPLLRLSCPKPGIYLVALERDAHLITLAAKKFNRYLAEEGLDAVLAQRKKRGEADAPGRERYRRYLKCLLRAGGKGDGTWKKSAGHKLEILPLADPTALKAGDTLKVRILFEGKPLAGAKVTAFRRAGKKVVAHSAVSSARGEACFPFDAAGPCLVRLVHMRRSAHDSEADWHSFWAALSFAVR